MNKQELVAFVANETESTLTAASAAIDAVFAGITLSLQKGDDVRLVGFGTFARAHRAAKEGRNPQTGAAIKIPASFQAKFKAGKGLKEAVNKTKKK
jgi:DNA-binding protein HU-beta